MQIPILNGVYSDVARDYRTSHPINMEPIPKTTGISDGYLRITPGILLVGSASGISRGGMEWNGEMYRVSGENLYSYAPQAGTTNLASTPIGGSNPLPNDGKPVTMTHSFDHLAIATAGELYLYDGTTLAQVTDPDLGPVLSVAYQDGYFVTTDGENIIATELGDPFSVLPLKYASSEVDPDPVNSVIRLRDEIIAMNRYTIETFANVGGSNFPFQVVDGTQVYRGSVGTHAAALFMGGIAFVGGGRNEQEAVYVYASGGTVKISTREIDMRLAEYSRDELADLQCETRVFEGREVLYIHTPNGTLCYDGMASQAIGQPVWFELQSDPETGIYFGRHFVHWNNGWYCGHPQAPNTGLLTDKADVNKHFAQKYLWEFSTPIVYGDGRGAIIHQIDLALLNGGADANAPQFIPNDSFEAHIDLDWTEDGLNYSVPRTLRLGARGDYRKPARFTRLGMMRQFRSFRFRGDSDARISISRVEAQIEGMSW